MHKILKNDVRKAFDIQSYLQFDLCKLRVSPTAGTSTDAVTLTTAGTSAEGTNNMALHAGHIRAMTDVMKERNIPPFVGDDYAAIAWPSTYRAFKTDMEAINQYTEAGFALIHSAEVGRYENVRFIEQTFINKGGAADEVRTPITDYTAWNNAKSDWMFIFGEDTVAEGIVIPEEIRGKIPSDYGRSKGIAWYALIGYGLIHTSTAATNGRIVKWSSSV